MKGMGKDMELSTPPRLEFAVEPDISVTIVEGLSLHGKLIPCEVVFKGHLGHIVN